MLNRRNARTNTILNHHSLKETLFIQWIAFFSFYYRISNVWDVPVSLMHRINLTLLILSGYLVLFLNQQVKFLNKCGADQTCRADLLLQGRVLHVPSEMGLDLNVVNSTSEVVLDLTLTNRQETAYGIKLTVNVQGQIRFITATGVYRVHFSLSAHWYVSVCFYACLPV